MKKLLAVILAAGLGAAVAALLMAKNLTSRHAAQLAEQQAAWQAEKAAMEAALDEANSRAPVLRMPVAAPAAPLPVAPAASAKASPADIVAKLRALRGARPDTRTARQAIAWLEELIAAGPEALPAIREFLARNEDMEFAPSVRGGRTANVPNEFIVPPSLRFGLFDVVKQIGGTEAETLLAEVLGATGRGAEVGWLARALQDMAPNKYRDVALAAARNLLARSPTATGPNPADRSERDQLFGVLTMYGDRGYVTAAQAQLLRPDGEVDRSALKYLQQSLGQQAVDLAARLYDDPRLTDPAKKEPFARLALNFVGADAQADGFYQKAINDMALSEGHRKNLIEDLNQDGFPDTRNLSARDLPLIQNRIAFIEQNAPLATDPVNVAAFKEAYKDLLKMREQASRPVP